MNYLNGQLVLGILLFLGIFYWLYTGSFVDISKTTRWTGKVEKVFTTRQNNSGSHSLPLNKLAFKIEGINQFLCYYKLIDNYKELQSKIKVGEIVTVYYSPTNKEYNLSLYQIEKEGDIIIDKSYYESKERLGSYSVLVIGVGILGYVLSMRIRAQIDYKRRVRRG